MGETIMEKQNRIGRVDWAVMLGCGVLVLMTLGSVGETGRRRAKEHVCQANLRQWHGVFQGIIEENHGQFLSGINHLGYWWPIQLSQELQDWKRNRTWFCPTATTPFTDDKGTHSPNVSTFNAWGIYRMSIAVYQGEIYYMNPNGIAGSCGVNGYVIPIPDWSNYNFQVPASAGWRDLHAVPDAANVPMFLDALRFDLWPLHTHGPAELEHAAWHANDMARACINRHDGAVNCLFVDGSVRKVGLKELWTLKWHRSFNTAGPWTKAGGVQPEDWPEWMRPFKEY
jgi:prepilin-type processing-associated H-X9-DG protein